MQPLHLRDRGMGLVNDEQEVFGKIIQQRRGRFARRPPTEMARIVLDAVAVAHRTDHLQIELCALLDALGFQ